MNVRSSFRKILILFLIFSMVLVSCDVQGPEPIGWATPEGTTTFGDVSLEEDTESIEYSDSEDDSDIDDYSPDDPGFDEGTSCDSRMIVCKGDEKNGFEEVLGPSGTVVEIVFRINNSDYVFEIVDGKYYLHCGVGVTKEVTESYVDNLKDAVDDIETANEEYENIEEDFWKGLVAVGASAVAGCIIGAIVAQIPGSAAPVVGNITGAAAGCLIGMGWGTVTSVVGVIATYGYDLWTNSRDVKEAENALKTSVQDVCQ